MSTKHKTTHANSFHRWPEGAIVYQIYPRSFYDSNADGIGDIPGIVEKLDYLKELGVNAIWLSPFYPSPMADFGYDVADYCDVDPIFGNLADIEKLLREAHANGIRVMVDLVLNHSSDEHEWFRQSRQSREGTYSDWYVWRDAKGHDEEGRPISPNNWLSMFNGQSAWEWEPARQQFYLHTFDIKQPDLNWNNKVVREAVKGVMRFWLDRGVDGFRADAVVYTAKDPLYRDNPPNPHYKKGKESHYNSQLHVNSEWGAPLYSHLEEMAAVMTEERYRHAERFMVTEAYPQTHSHVEEYLAFYEGMDPEVAAPFIFEGLTQPWQADVWRKFLTVFHTALADFSRLCVASYAFGNHDQPRLATRLGDPSARAAAVLLLTLPGMSFIYYGDELGMSDGVIPPDMVQDPGAQDGPGRDPERTPMHWSASKNAGFSSADTTWLPIANNYLTHNIEAELTDPGSFLSLYKRLGKLRNQSPALRYGTLEVIETGNQDVLGFRRSDDGEICTTLVNFSKAACKLTLDPKKLGTFVVSSDPKTKLRTAKSGEIKLGPNEAAVFQSEA